MNAHHFQLEFKKSFGESENEIQFYFAPGRVNIIGEHLDYNGGFVLPFALTLGTYLLIRKRKDDVVKIASLQFNLSREISLATVSEKIGNGWWNYPLGVLHEFKKKIDFRCGFEMFFDSDLPIGVGLSSSASIEVAAAFALNDLLNTNFTAREIALLSKKAENEFVGVQCGIMDQFAAAVGKEDHALFLNCATAAFDYIPLRLDDFEFVIANTNKSRQLETSSFNDRYQECTLALKIMQRLLFVNYLAQATPHDFEMIEHWFPDENLRKRARHIVFENERVKKAADALTNSNVGQLATLMNESHASLRDNYEVSCFELDELVKAARAVDGCLSSRITGAGFGGCTISLIKKGIKEKFCEQVADVYEKATGLKTAFYDASSGDGMSKKSTILN